MKMIDGNRFALTGPNAETIIVSVKATGTEFLVAYRLKGGRVIDGPSNESMTEGSPFRFKLDNTDGDRNKLSLGFTFASPSNVSGEPASEAIEYEVVITGSEPDSDISREFVIGSFDIPGDNRQWRFLVQ